MRSNSCAKMFDLDWGLALFLGVAFRAISFETQCAPAENYALRWISCGSRWSLWNALKRKGKRCHRRRLCATGISIPLRHLRLKIVLPLSLLRMIPTFARMSLITAAAFLLAVRMDALVVAILGNRTEAFSASHFVHRRKDIRRDYSAGINRAARGRFASRSRVKERESLRSWAQVGTGSANRVGRKFSERTVLRPETKTLSPMTGSWLQIKFLFLIAALTSKREGKWTLRSPALPCSGAFAMTMGILIFSFTTIGSRPV